MTKALLLKVRNAILSVCLLLSFTTEAVAGCGFWNVNCNNMFFTACGVTVANGEGTLNWATYYLITDTNCFGSCPGSFCDHSCFNLTVNWTDCESYTHQQGGEVCC